MSERIVPHHWQNFMPLKVKTSITTVLSVENKPITNSTTDEPMPIADGEADQGPKDGPSQVEMELGPRAKRRRLTKPAKMSGSS